MKRAEIEGKRILITGATGQFAKPLDADAMHPLIIARDPFLRCLDRLEGTESLRERRFIRQSLMGFIGAVREYKEMQNKIQ